ncbi:predicted protein [Nematostella vectensis]|uniref:DIS3-like exonuclease 1 n=1 Tax=Nematostella vectensis TaxID=45351 RepID=A7S7H2_NEMVE|nr:predicted protein [Nematostella vectensis]|eukprot:XP_001632370.1 predicted protein [Nematostella vectensis]
MLKTNKLLRLKTKRSRLVNVVREHYLRTDISCHSSLCQECKNNNTPTGLVSLSSDLTHYVVPDCEVSKLYLEIFEFPEIQGVIFFQTVKNHLQHSGSRKLLSRLKNLVKDTRQQCTFFSNEFCEGAYVPREAGESLQDWQARCTYAGVLWYYHHLHEKMPLVMVTSSEEVIERYNGRTMGVFVMSMSDYISGFYPGLTSVHELFESLSTAIAVADSNKSHKGHKECSEYLPLDVLEAGIKSGRYIKGNLNVNKHNSQTEAFIQKRDISSGQGTSESDVLIYGVANRNRAVHGDVVVVEVLPKSQWKGRSTALKLHEEDAEDSGNSSDVMMTGHVVGVLQRNWRDYVVSFAEDVVSQDQRRSAGKVVVVPWDYRIPKIRISTRQVEALRDQRYVIRIDSWEVDSMYPSGHFVRALGLIGDLETEVATLMVEHTLSAPPFTDGQLKELPSDSPTEPWVISEEEVCRRRDLRKSHLVFSIDPKGCEDVDDTLSIRQLKDGRLELGVHIADVTHFVHPGSLTDAEARSRSTSVYLADRRYDMLPEILSANLCSLISGVDRLAMSVMWVLGSNYDVIKTWYGRTIIRSSYKLFYEVAQAIADGVVPNEDLLKEIPELQGLDSSAANKGIQDIRWSVLKLMDIARYYKARRQTQGAVELDNPEVKVLLNEKKDILDLIDKQGLEIHETIEECMILANHWVAKRLVQTFPTCSLLRRHPLPRQQYFENLMQCAKAKGFTIKTSSNKLLAESLDKCEDPDDPTFNKLLRILAVQAMSSALYFSTGSVSVDEFVHYGLALDRYTHFTSPIRRYADVIVHRLLMAALGSDDQSQVLNNEELEELAQHMNDKHKVGHTAAGSVELFQTLFFNSMSEDDERLLADAVIVGLRANGLLVYIPRYCFKSAVYLKDKNGLVVTPGAGKDCVTHGPGSIVRGEFAVELHTSSGVFTFKLFNHVKVKISVATSRAHAQSLRVTLVSFQTRTGPPPGELNSGELSKANKRKEMIREIMEINRPSPVERNQMASDFTELKAEYGQTNAHVSLYNLLEHFRELSLLDT